jgi:hypothetical protein
MSMQPIEFHALLGASSVVLSFFSFIPYIRSILKKKTRPSGASWWTWSFLAIITVLSSWSAGASWEVLILPTWLFVSQLTVAILSIKRGDNNWDTWNKLCVAGALAGIVLWMVTGNPLIALMFSITADLFASIPNWRHVWRNPEQENILGWGMGWGSAVLEIFAIKNLSLAESSWAIYFLVTISITFFLISRKKLKRFFN